MGKTSYFYVLYCRDGSLYGGYTVDLTRRLHEHNNGIGAKYTRARSRRPLTMIYAETYRTKSEALRAEAAFKKKTRPQKDVFLKRQGVPFPLNESDLLLVKVEGQNILMDGEKENE